MRVAAEAVADAPDGFDIDGRGGIRLDLFADAVDVNHDGCRIAEGVHAPDAVEELVLAEGNAGILREEEQKVKFAARERDFLAVREDAARFGADFEPAGEDAVRFLYRLLREALVACDMRLDASREFIGAEGLDDVVVGAEAEAANLVDFLLTCRDHEDRRVFFLADGAADDEAVRTWQHEVEQDEVEVFGERLFFALFAVGDDFHGKVVGFEVVALKFCSM